MLTWLFWFLLFAIWVGWEIYYWMEWKKSLARNRMVYVHEHDPQRMLQVLEECAEIDPNVFMAVLHSRTDGLTLKEECQRVVQAKAAAKGTAIAIRNNPFILTEQAVEKAILTVLNVRDLRDIAKLPKVTLHQINKTRKTLFNTLSKKQCKAMQPHSKPTASLDDHPPLLLNNIQSRIYTIWLPSFVDMIDCLYYRRLEYIYRSAGFKEVQYHGVPFFVRNLDQLNHPTEQASQAPPLICFHGISGIMPMVPTLVPYLEPNRVIICPRHPTIIASMRCRYGKGEMMTTLQFIRHVVSFIESQPSIHTLDVLGWSYGGLQYNNFLVELKLRQLKIQVLLDSKPSLFGMNRPKILAQMESEPTTRSISIRRVVMTEPMGLAICNAVGGTYSLLSWMDAFKRAQYVAPGARTWHNIAAVTHFQRPKSEIPISTDPMFSEHTQAEVRLWNNKNLLIFFSRSDIVTPMRLVQPYFEKQIPNTNILIDDGEHGTWPTRKAFYIKASQWLA